MCWFAPLNNHAVFTFLRTECYAKRCAVFDFICVALFFKFKAVWVVSSFQWMKQPIHCKMISSAVLALIHRDSHTQSCFLMALHTCRGYEQGINITRSTHFHLTLTSLFAPPPSPTHSSLCLSLCLPPSKPRESIGGSLYWSQRLGFAPRRLKCHRLPDVSLKSPVPPLAVAPGFYYPPLKEWQSGPRRCDTDLCAWNCSAVSSWCFLGQSDGRKPATVHWASAGMKFPHDSKNISQFGWYNDYCSKMLSCLSKINFFYLTQYILFV